MKSLADEAQPLASFVRLLMLIWIEGEYIYIYIYQPICHMVEFDCHGKDNIICTTLKSSMPHVIDFFFFFFW